MYWLVLVVVSYGVVLLNEAVIVNVGAADISAASSDNLTLRDNVSDNEATNYSAPLTRPPYIPPPRRSYCERTVNQSHICQLCCHGMAEMQILAYDNRTWDLIYKGIDLLCKEVPIYSCYNWTFAWIELYIEELENLNSALDFCMEQGVCTYGYTRSISINTISDKIGVFPPIINHFLKKLK